MPFTVTIPVQFRDLDCMGHVNNAVYISYMEHGRVSFCAQFPELDFGNPQNRIGKGLILARISCDFKRPVELGETIQVDVTIPRVGNASFDMHYELRLANTQTIVTTGDSVQVYYDYAARRPLPLPPHLKAPLIQHRA